MPLIAQEMLHTLPEKDAFRAVYQLPDLVKKMIADGYTGRKGKGGFYRLVTDDKGKKKKEAIDLKTGEYRAEKKAKLESVDAAKAGAGGAVQQPGYRRAIRGGGDAQGAALRGVAGARDLRRYRRHRPGDAHGLQLEIRPVPAHRPLRGDGQERHRDRRFDLGKIRHEGAAHRAAGAREKTLRGAGRQTRPVFSFPPCGGRSGWGGEPQHSAQLHAPPPHLLRRGGRGICPCRCRPAR